MLQLKDFVKCGSPYKPYELHVSHEQMEELIKRDVAMDKILELRDTEDNIDPEQILILFTDATGDLKND